MSHARSLARRGSALLAATVLIGLSSGAPARADDTVAFTISDSRVTESSGLTRDVPGNRYWTVNDSGNSARAYAVGTKGRVLGFAGYQADTVDVEAVAYVGGYLYLADIGDNTMKRKTVTVYRIYNPSPDGTDYEYQAYDFTYPDGPRDAEAVLVDKNGRISIISKEADGGIYRAPAESSRLRTNRLTRIADAPSFVTDATYLTNGDIAVRTYVSVQILDPDSYKVIAQAPTPAEPQGESLSLNLAGTALLVGSEGKKQPVYQLAVPTSVQQAPSAGATPGTPSPSASRSSTGESTSAAEVADDTTSGSTLLVTLLVAAAVAVVAGLVTFFIRRR